MPFQPGNKLAELATAKERVDIRRITLKVWKIAEKVLADENYPDQQFRQRLIEKIISRSTPQNLELTGKDGTPLFLPTELMEKYHVAASITESNSK